MNLSLGNQFEKAILVQIDFLDERSRDQQLEDFEEFQKLTLSAGIQPVSFIKGTRKNPDAKYFAGQGKASEVQQAVQQHQANLVLLNHVLSPIQVRNLEQLCSCRVLDRTELILEIFARHAHTFEGKLQVDLAKLKHQSNRLVRGWTHLERQKGGIGLRGPGEKQLEMDRRAIRKKIKFLQERLQKVRNQREQSRKRRSQKRIPTVSLVGYTNSGKSTLFNRLTQSSVYTADQLFATLDPTARQITLPHFGPVIIIDTVGFIRHLPHHLIEAFRATLEETKTADLLLHVIDTSTENRQENITAVDQVLSHIEASSVPQLFVFNKIDLLPSLSSNSINHTADHSPSQVWVSAKTGDGIDQLLQMMTDHLSKETIHCCLRLSPKNLALYSHLHKLKAILNEQFAENGDYLVEIKLPASELEFLMTHDKMLEMLKI